MRQHDTANLLNPRLKEATMSDDVYERLADALDRLPNGFPRTASGVEIAILKHLFSPEEANLALQVGGEWTPLPAIAERMGMAEREARAALKPMTRRGLVWGYIHGGTRHYRMAPFIVGFYEAQLETMDHKLAHMVEEYMAQGGAAGIMRPQPAHQRVVPARGSVKAEWILPYDDVKALLQNAKTFRVRDCICRVQQKMIGKGCDAPIHNCLSFSDAALPTTPNDVTLEQALALLDEAEGAALVHSVSNVAQGVSYICNCCGCCCGILRGITEYGIQESMAAANYYGSVDADACSGCGLCEGRCQVGAIMRPDGVAEVDRLRCIGCGLCVTGCPQGAVTLHIKPEAEIIHPPADLAAWEQQRLRNRGLD